MSTIFKKILFSCVALFAVISNANALTSNGSDGAFVVNGEVTLNVTDGQVFNFTTIDINAGGILNLVGSSPSSSFSMLASGDINIAGVLNIYTNTIFETAGKFNALGKLNVYNGSLTLSNDSVSSNLQPALNTGHIDAGKGITACSKPNCDAISGVISIPSIINPPALGDIQLIPPVATVISGGNLSVVGGFISATEVIINDRSPELIASSVPEPSSYALLLSGIALITLARRKTFN